jgi:hypothetical protein
MPLPLVDERDRNSSIVTTTNDRVSSAGSFDNKFLRVPEGDEQDDECRQVSDRSFYIGPESPRRNRLSTREVEPGNTATAINAVFRKRLPTRKVEPRNTPTTINAVFLQRNFWDSRANSLFNGVGVFGMRDIKGDPTKRLIVQHGDGLELTWLEIENASLASQAVGPPTSHPDVVPAGPSPLVRRWSPQAARTQNVTDRQHARAVRHAAATAWSSRTTRT